MRSKSYSDFEMIYYFANIYILSIGTCLFFQVFMRKLGQRDMDLFEDQKSDQKYLKGKMSKGTLDAVSFHFCLITLFI